MKNETASLVEREVSLTKLRREMEQWRLHSSHRERGWMLLRYDEATLQVEIGFLARVTLSSGTEPLPAMVCAVRFTYDNYDLLPPSVEFIDPWTGAAARPHVRAFNVIDNAPREVLIDAHPETQAPFLCIPGVREYHSHPQHTGDAWLLHRAMGAGNLSTLCERIWRFMVVNVLGLNVQMQTLPGFPLRAQFAVSLAQGPVTRQVGSVGPVGGSSPKPPSAA